MKYNAIELQCNGQEDTPNRRQINSTLKKVTNSGAVRIDMQKNVQSLCNIPLLYCSILILFLADEGLFTIMKENIGSLFSSSSTAFSQALTIISFARTT